MPREDRQLERGRLQEGQGESRQTAGKQTLAEREKRQRRLGDLHGRPPVGTREDSSVPRVRSWGVAAEGVVDAARVGRGGGCGGRRGVPGWLRLRMLAKPTERVERV